MSYGEPILIDYPATAKLKDLSEGTEFRSQFEIVQQKKDPTFYIAILGTNKAIGRVIIPKGAVNGDTEVKLQWFELVKMPAPARKKVSKKK